MTTQTQMLIVDSYESAFTQDDAFELDGCGVTAVNRAVARQFLASLPRMIVRTRARKAALAAEYERGHADGYAECEYDHNLTFNL